MSRRWHVVSRNINEVIVAPDQWEAWDALKNREAEDFGLVVTAEPDGNGDLIPVKTQTLMIRWGRLAAAEAFHVLAIQLGLVE